MSGVKLRGDQSVLKAIALGVVVVNVVGGDNRNPYFSGQRDRVPDKVWCLLPGSCAEALRIRSRGQATPCTSSTMPLLVLVDRPAGAWLQVPSRPPVSNTSPSE